MRMLAICQVDRPGPAEATLLALADILTGGHGWQVTVTSPGDELPDGSGAHVGDGCEHWEPLDVGGLMHGAGARAVAAWPRAWRLAHQHDLVYVNGSVAARLLPALRSRATALHLHHHPRRASRHWHSASVVIVSDAQAAASIAPLGAHVIAPPATRRLTAGGATELDIAPYAARLMPLLERAVADHGRLPADTPPSETTAPGTAPTGSRR